MPYSLLFQVLAPRYVLFEKNLFHEQHQSLLHLVSTPQDVAVIDVVRGIDFFQKEHIEVPILGIVENMAWFTPAELPDNKYYIFGKGGVQTLAQETNIPFLGHIPIVQSIREGGDAGNPIVLQNSLAGTYFIDIAEKIAQNIQD